MAGKPQKNLAYSVLLDFYGPALTEKELPQKEQHANYIKNVLHCNHRR